MIEMETNKTEDIGEGADETSAAVTAGEETESRGKATKADGRTIMTKAKSAEKIAGYLSKFTGKEHPAFKPGDTVRVHYKIVEGNKERIQAFEGVVIALRHAGLDKTFTVRKVSWNIGVERTFFYNSSKVDKIEVVRRGKVNRAKIYYLRKRIGKAARIKELRKPKPTAKQAAKPAPKPDTQA